MQYTNFHTHSTYCDGKNSLEDIVLEALRLGCPQIGFSSHAPMPFETGYSMTQISCLEYINEVRELKEKYSGQIEILLGIETDYFSRIDTTPYDYVIRSVHYVYKDGNYLPVDHSEGVQVESVNSYYGGDFQAYAKDYYSSVAGITLGDRCDVIGHFDLVTKYNEADKLFDTHCDEYRSTVFRTIDAIFDATDGVVIFEYNTGAISRGHRKTAYPDDFILDYLSQNYAGRFKFLISSDAHSKENLLFGFDMAHETLTGHGLEITKGFPF